MTYAAIDYAYFALAQSFNIQQAREERFKYSITILKITFNNNEFFLFKATSGE